MRVMYADEARDALLEGQDFPEGLLVKGPFFLDGYCSIIDRLPDTLVIAQETGSTARWLWIDDCYIDDEKLVIEQDLPEIVVADMPGRRLSEVMSNRLLEGRPIMDLVIKAAVRNDEDRSLYVKLDGNPLDSLSKVGGLRRMKPHEAREAIVAGKTFPHGLTVEGPLELTDCTSLTALPDFLNVDGSLILSGCTNLKALPDHLTFYGSLDLQNCISLIAFPSCLTVHDTLNLTGCTSLEALPDSLTVGSLFFLEGYSISYCLICINKSITPVPEIFMESIQGRPLSEVFSHHLIDNRPIMDLIITSAKINRFGGLDFEFDENPLEHLSVVNSLNREAA